MLCQENIEDDARLAAAWGLELTLLENVDPKYVGFVPQNLFDGIRAPFGQLFFLAFEFA